jgi:hypothetical protein
LSSTFGDDQLSPFSLLPDLLSVKTVCSRCLILHGREEAHSTPASAGVCQARDIYTASHNSADRP